jgi:ABC-type bacteriocin/lantibiotic exporter with double-glycine peptidase domain
MKYISFSTSRPSSLLKKIAAVIMTVFIAVVALMFSAVLLTAILIVGAVVWIYLWWMTRALRKQMQNLPSSQTNTKRKVFDGEVFEGEVISRDESAGSNKR